MLVKVAPDLSERDIDAAARVLGELKVDGVIATNTTVDHSKVAGDPLANEAGGLSGAPVLEQSTLVLRRLRARLPESVPLVGVGGILSGADAVAKMAAGAALVQCYSGLIFRGPALVSECVEAIRRRREAPSRGAVAPLAAQLLELHDPTLLPDVLALPEVGNGPLLVLGSGSNVLIAEDLPGTVLVFGNRDISFLEHRADHAVIRAGAGVPWHGLVMWSLQEGLSGLENLALIPGTAGAAPIQNIGAYGAQIGEFIQAVEAWDCHEQAWVRLDNEQCGFGYRDSVFKQQMDRYLITAIELKLPLLHDLRMDYAGIREELQAQGVELPGAVDVANAVIAIRRRKLPDPDVLGNAGSFFKNPVKASARSRLPG
ncbi:hypothetical protein G6F22_012728 [Rhizopus arrhizus]|nr:hypothetical protein G6F22_012728 [Rhizopus arrhizus]